MPQWHCHDVSFPPIKFQDFQTRATMMYTAAFVCMFFFDQFGYFGKTWQDTEQTAGWKMPLHWRGLWQPDFLEISASTQTHSVLKGRQQGTNRCDTATQSTYENMTSRRVWEVSDIDMQLLLHAMILSQAGSTERQSSDPVLDGTAFMWPYLTLICQCNSARCIQPQDPVRGNFFVAVVLFTLMVACAMYAAIMQRWEADQVIQIITNLMMFSIFFLWAKCRSEAPKARFHRNQCWKG